MAVNLSHKDQLNFLKKLSEMYCPSSIVEGSRYVILDQKRENLDEVTQIFLRIADQMKQIPINLKIRQAVLSAGTRLEDVYKSSKNHEGRASIAGVIEIFRRYSYERFMKDFQRVPRKGDSDLVMWELGSSHEYDLPEDESSEIARNCVFFLFPSFIINFDRSPEQKNLTAFSPFIGILDESFLQIDLWGNPWIKSLNGDISLNDLFRDFNDYVQLFLVDLMSAEGSRRTLAGLSDLEKMKGYQITRKMRSFYESYQQIKGKGLREWLGYLTGKGSVPAMREIESLERLFSQGWI